MYLVSLDSLDHFPYSLTFNNKNITAVCMTFDRSPMMIIFSSTTHYSYIIYGNKVEERYAPENGYASKTTSITAPAQVINCVTNMWFN